MNATERARLLRAAIHRHLISRPGITAKEVATHFSIHYKTCLIHINAIRREWRLADVKRRVK